MVEATRLVLESHRCCYRILPLSTSRAPRSSANCNIRCRKRPVGASRWLPSCRRCRLRHPSLANISMGFCSLTRHRTGHRWFAFYRPFTRSSYAVWSWYRFGKWCGWCRWGNIPLSTDYAQALGGAEDCRCDRRPIHLGEFGGGPTRIFTIWSMDG